MNWLDILRKEESPVDKNIFSSMHGLVNAINELVEPNGRIRKIMQKLSSGYPDRQNIRDAGYEIQHFSRELSEKLAEVNDIIELQSQR